MADSRKMISQRFALASAYGAVAGSEATSGLAGLTYEALLEQQLERLTGGGVNERSAVGTIDRIVADLEAVASALEEGTKDLYSEKVPDEPVNTQI